MFVVPKALLVLALVSLVWGGEGDSITGPSGQDNPCLLPRISGMCMAYFQKFYYDSNTGTCKEFIYGGCGGNGNRFESKGDCMEACGAKVNMS